MVTVDIQGASGQEYQGGYLGVNGNQIFIPTVKMNNGATSDRGWDLWASSSSGWSYDSHYGEIGSSGERIQLMHALSATSVLSFNTNDSQGRVYLYTDGGSAEWSRTQASGDTIGHFKNDFHWVWNPSNTRALLVENDSDEVHYVFYDGSSWEVAENAIPTVSSNQEFQGATWIDDTTFAMSTRKFSSDAGNVISFTLKSGVDGSATNHWQQVDTLTGNTSTHKSFGSGLHYHTGSNQILVVGADGNTDTYPNSGLGDPTGVDLYAFISGSATGILPAALSSLETAAEDIFSWNLKGYIPDYYSYGNRFFAISDTPSADAASTTPKLVVWESGSSGWKGTIAQDSTFQHRFNYRSANSHASSGPVDSDNKMHVAVQGPSSVNSGNNVRIFTFTISAGGNGGGGGGGSSEMARTKINSSTQLSISAALIPDTADGAALGSAAKEWSDVYLADGGILYFGSDQEITVTHVADSGLTFKHAASGDDKFFTMTLQAGDTDIAANDKLGVINFQAPDEGTGTDAILVAAGIEAVSEGDFAADSNATKLSFKTASSAAAAETMSLSSVGVLTVAGKIVTDDDTEATTTTDGSLQTDGGLSVAKSAVIGDDLDLLSNGAIFKVGSAQPFTLTHSNANNTAMVSSGHRLAFGDAAEYISGDGTDLTIAASADLNLTATADINIPSGVGLTFGNDGEKIEGDGTDLTISGNNINLTATADVNLPSGVGLTFASAEKIESDGTDLTITVGAGGDINIGSDIGLTFGDDGEKIEGDGTDLTISSSGLLNLTATSDVVIPANVGLVLDGSGAEKIESDGTDISFSVGAGGDINIPADIGLTFGNDGEKIEGNGTDLTISGNNINLTAVADIVVPADVGITFGTGEKIEGDNTDLTVTSGGKINLTATSDVILPSGVGLVLDGSGAEKIESDGTDISISVGAGGDVNLPADIGLTFGDDGEKIEGNGTDLTIASSNDLNLTATADINVPASVGMTFGDDGEKIEGDGTDLTVASSNDLNLTVANNLVIDAQGSTSGDGISMQLGDDTSGTKVKVLNDTGAEKFSVDALGDVTVGRDLTITRNLVVQGSTTTVDSTTINVSSSFTFEGPADAHETTLHAGGDGTGDAPAADTTIYLPALSSSGNYFLPVMADKATAASAAVTAAEFALLDGGSTVATVTVADGDGVLFNDAGTMKQVTVQSLAAYFDDEITAMPNLVEAGALDAGSITSGFGAIDNGTSNITTGGLFSIDVDSGATINSSGGGVGAAGSITLGTGADAGFYVASDDLYIENKTSDKDIIFRVNDGGTFTTIAHVDGADGRFQFAAGKLDIGGTAVTSTAAEFNLMDGDTAVGSSITIADADGFIIHDNGTMKKIPATDVKAYCGGAITAGNGLQSDGASNPTFSVDVEREVFMKVSGAEHQTTANGLTASLNATPLSADGTSVYLNGILLTPSGSAGDTFDYRFFSSVDGVSAPAGHSQDDVYLEDALDSDDVLTIQFVKA